MSDPYVRLADLAVDIAMLTAQHEENALAWPPRKTATTIDRVRIRQRCRTILAILDAMDREDRDAA